MAAKDKVYAVVGPGGTVENIIVAGDDFAIEGRDIVPDPKRKASIGGTWDGASFKPPPEPEPEPVKGPYTYKEDIWNRVTDDEATALYQALDAAPPRLRGIWLDSITIDHSGPMFSQIRDMIGKALKTKKRADEVLAPR